MVYITGSDRVTASWSRDEYVTSQISLPRFRFGEVVFIFRIVAYLCQHKTGLKRGIHCRDFISGEFAIACDRFITAGLG
jgi:hypothetical protein